MLHGLINPFVFIYKICNNIINGICNSVFTQFDLDLSYELQNLNIKTVQDFENDMLSDELADYIFQYGPEPVLGAMFKANLGAEYKLIVIGKALKWVSTNEEIKNGDDHLLQESSKIIYLLMKKADKYLAECAAKKDIAPIHTFLNYTDNLNEYQTIRLYKHIAWHLPEGSSNKENANHVIQSMCRFSNVRRFNSPGEEKRFNSFLLRALERDEKQFKKRLEITCNALQEYKETNDPESLRNVDRYLSRSTASLNSVD